LQNRFFLTTYAALGVSPLFAAGTAALPAAPGANSSFETAFGAQALNGFIHNVLSNAA